MSADGRLEVRAEGDPGLDVTVRALKDIPPLPAGWFSAGPAFDISAKAGDKQLTALAQPLSLRFRADGPATVLVYVGRDWLLVESRVQTDGTVTAAADQLAIYTVARPRMPADAPAPAPARSSTVSTGSNTPVPVSRFTPVAASGAVTPEEARPALEAAIEQLKRQKLEVANAGGFTGVTMLPSVLQQTIERAASVEGKLFYGQYRGVNEAFATSGGASGPHGQMTFLIEPRTVMPGSAREAQALLAKLFPGALGPAYTQQKNVGGNFIFFALDGGAAYVLAVIQYQGMTFAYAGSGSGTYAGILTMAATIQ
jgi:hypothetical protein